MWPVFRIKVSMWPVAAEEQSCPRGVAFCPQSVSGEEGRGRPGRAQGAGDWGGGRDCRGGTWKTVSENCQHDIIASSNNHPTLVGFSEKRRVRRHSWGKDQL